MTATHSKGQSNAKRPLRQEQEDATDEVTEVAPGVLRSQLPIQFTGLGHVNMYLFEDDRGVAIVDPGLPGEQTYQAVQNRLAAAGIPLRRVHTVIITHSHPDHFGGVGRIVQETGAEVVTDKRFKLWWEPDGGDVELELATPTDRQALRERLERPTPWGGSSTTLTADEEKDLDAVDRGQDWMDFKKFRPTIRLEDEQPFLLAGREWSAVYTPGHTDDHLCLYDPTEGLLLSGDHVLPSITPHISGLIEGDTLGRYIQSLDRVAALPDIKMVLPAHGHPFHDLPGRVDEIKAHHEGRLDQLRVISSNRGWTTVPDLSHELFSQRNWGSMAESETFAHLEYLRLLGQAERREEGGRLYYLIPA